MRKTTETATRPQLLRLDRTPAGGRSEWHEGVLPGHAALVVDLLAFRDLRESEWTELDQLEQFTKRVIARARDGGFQSTAEIGTVLEAGARAIAARSEFGDLAL